MFKILYFSYRDSYCTSDFSFLIYVEKSLFNTKHIENSYIKYLEFLKHIFDVK